MGAHSSERERRDIQAILDAIRHIVQRLRESSREAERRNGLTAAQVFVLELLRDDDALSVNELAARTYTHQSSVSVVVSRLARRGLVRTRRSTTDARRRALSITPRGRAALRGAPVAAQTDVINALRALPDTTRHDLASTMRRIARAVGRREQPVMFFERGGAG
jgi:DNA-binding MarR family transcriptional regulator